MRCGLADWFLPTLALLQQIPPACGCYNPGDVLHFFLQAHWPDYSKVTFFDFQLRVVVDGACGSKTMTIYEQPELFFPPLTLFVKLIDWVIPAEFGDVCGFKVYLTYTAVYSNGYVERVFEKLDV